MDEKSENNGGALAVSGGGAPAAMGEANSFALLLNREAMTALIEQARFVAESDLLPEHYKKKPANIVIAWMKARALGIEPMGFLEQTYVVHGKLGMLGTLPIALINDRFIPSRKDLRGPLKWRFEGEGDKRECVAYVEGNDGQVAIEGPPVTMRMVKAEGWKAKWDSMPDLMFRYRAATFFCRTNCPSLMMGMRTIDELEDIGAVETTARRVNDDAPVRMNPDIPPMPKEKTVGAPPADTASAAADGASAEAAPDASRTPGSGGGPAPTNGNAMISDEQRKYLLATYREAYPDAGRELKELKEVLGEFGWSSSKEIPASRFNDVMAALRERIKKDRSNAQAEA